MTEVAEISQFDDSYTIRRKWAYILKTHFDTLIYLDDKYVNLEDANEGYYAKYYNENVTFSEMAENILQDYKYIFSLDIVMSFVKYIGPQNITDWEYMFEQFYAIDNNRKYLSENDFLDKYYKIWNNERDALLGNKEAYEIITRTLSDLENLEEKAIKGNYYITSEFKHANVSFVINPTLKDGSQITYKDGIDIFDSIIVSDSVPFVKYNDEIKSYYKVFRGDSINSIPNYANIDIPEDQSNDINVIYMKLWSKSNGEVEKAGKKDYIRVTYYLKYNKIMFTLPDVQKNINEEEAFNILTDTFTNLNLNDKQRVDVKGIFNIFSYEEAEDGSKIYPLTFDEFSILDLMMRYIDGFNSNIEEEDYSYLLGSYFFLDEVENIFSTKVAMKLHYRSLTSGIDLGNKLRKDFRLPSISKANIELVNNITTLSEEYKIQEFDQEVIIPRATEYIQVNVNVKDEFELPLITRILKLALYAYNLYRDDITEEYTRVLGKGMINSLRLYQKEYKNVNLTEYQDSNSRKLKKLDKDIFVSSYPTICRNIPLAISEDEIDEWKNKKVKEVRSDGKVVEKERQIISFPKNDPKYNFVCEDPSSYIGMIKNTLSNRNEYSHLPCCYLVDQQVQGEATGYNEYYREIKTGPKGGKSKGLVKGKFILLPERYGNLPVQLNEMLNLYSNEPTRFYRYGVPSSINSLLHCVCKALAIDMYLAKENDSSSLEDYVEKIRGVLTKMPNVYKQELYDLTEENIVAALSDGNIFLDPALFYRGVEELFGVNIFVFVPTVDSAAIEVPRKWLFHVSNSKPNRTNILIYKHYGSNRDARDYPQCELIVEETKAGLMGTFDKSMFDICTAILGGMTSTVIWSPILGVTDNIKGNSDIYSLVNYNDIIEHSSYGQYIDKYGKCRGFNFKVKDEDAIYNLTMITPPTQPEDLPLMNTSSDINYTSHYLATTIFGNQTRVDINENNKAIGLWFRIFDVEEGIYVPIDEMDLSDISGKIVKGSENPLFQNKYSKVDRYSKLKRSVSIFLELLKWIYEIYKLDKRIPDGDSEAFVEEYFYVSNSVVNDSVDYYDFSNVPYRLPNIRNMSEVINYLKDTGMTDGEYLMFYNDNFANQAHEYIRRYNKYTEGLEGNPQTFISGYFQTTEDYKQDNYTYLFISSKSYREWLERVVYGPFRMFDINSDKLSEKAILTTPYIIYENGKYIMIQNVLSGDRERAIAVSLKWVQDKINLGYNVAPLNDDVIKKDIAVTLYTISIDSKLMLFSKPKRRKNRTSVDILRYGGSARNDKLSESVFTRYAAMLSLN